MSRKTKKETDTEKMAKKLISILETESDIAIELSFVPKEALMKTGAGQPQVDAILWILENIEQDDLLPRFRSILLLCAIAEHTPNLDFSNVLPKIIELTSEGYLLEKGTAISALARIATVIPECDLSAAVPILIASLEDIEPGSTNYAISAIGTIQKDHPEYDCSPAFPVLLKMLENSGDGLADICVLADALQAFEPRGYEDLKLVKKAGETLKGKIWEELGGVLSDEELEGMAHQESVHLSRLYSSWSKVLNERAQALVDKKNFPAPKNRKPDKADKVNRMCKIQRMVHSGRA